jgi:serine protease
MIGAPSAWQVATGAGQTIAIVDTGVDLNHGDLQNNKIVGAVSCIGSAGDSAKCKPGGQDDYGHGTHVAGIAAALTDNGVGVAGTAPDASILAVKVLDSTGSGSGDDVAAGIRYAADHGAVAINLSLGNVTQAVFGTSFQAALDYAFNKDAIPVIAAGNNFVLPSGPISHAIVVGALNRSGVKASYSNIGSSQWGIDAPGGEPDDTTDTCNSTTDQMGVLSTFFQNGYACLAGTSMAAPHVAGAVAVLRSKGFSRDDTIHQLLTTARPLPTTNLDGAGALDLAAAVGQPPTQPSPDTTPASETTVPSGSTASISGGGASSGGDPTASTPAGDLGGPTSTSPAVINPPNQRAAPAGRVTTHTPSNKDGLSTGIVVVAVAMAASVCVGLGWLFVRGQSWARRTPRLDR